MSPSDLNIETYAYFSFNLYFKGDLTPLWRTQRPPRSRDVPLGVAHGDELDAALVCFFFFKCDTLEQGEVLMQWVKRFLFLVRI